MAPKLIREGKIQVLGQTANSVVYAVASDSNTGYAKDSQTVLKGGTIWYEGREALGPGKDAEESDERARKEASIYEILGRHERILEFYGLETGILGDLRDHIASRSPADPPTLQTRLHLALQLAEGVAYLHSRGVIWGDPSTRNVLVVDVDVDVGRWRIKLGDFADSVLELDYPRESYCPPSSRSRSRRPRFSHTAGPRRCEMVALGSEICEICEWVVRYGPEGAVQEEDDVVNAAGGSRMAAVVE